MVLFLILIKTWTSFHCDWWCCDAQISYSLKNKGYQITGSDDAIFEPSFSIAKIGLLPENLGWFPEKLAENLDAVILGMHAKKENPELLKAQELG